MILRRYLTQQVLASTFATTAVVLAIILFGRLTRLLARISEGEATLDTVLSMLLFRVPWMLELVVPMGLMLGLLLTLGRLYGDREMVVLSASGVSDGRFLSWLLIPSLIVTALVTLLTFELSPYGARHFEQYLQRHAEDSNLRLLKPNMFHVLPGGNKMIHIGALDGGTENMKSIFFIENKGGFKSERPFTLILADAARFWEDPLTGVEFLQLYNGVRYQGVIKQKDYSVTHFERYEMPISQPTYSRSQVDIMGLNNRDLFHASTPQEHAELQWRLSMPILTLIVLLIAWPLAHSNPRSGKYARILPAILIYLGYLSSLSFVKENMASGQGAIFPGLFLVHLLFLCLAIGLNWRLLASVTNAYRKGHKSQRKNRS